MSAQATKAQPPRQPQPLSEAQQRLIRLLARQAVAEHQAKARASSAREDA